MTQLSAKAEARDTDRESHNETCRNASDHAAMDAYRLGRAIGKKVFFTESTKPEDVDSFYGLGYLQGWMEAAHEAEEQQFNNDCAYRDGVSDKRAGLSYRNTYANKSDEEHRAYQQGYEDASNGEAEVEP